MDYFLSFLFLIIAIALGIPICLLLGAKSYIKIAIAVLLLYIPMQLYNDYFMENKNKNKNKKTNTTIASTTTTIPDLKNITATSTSNIPDYHPLKDDANNGFARQKDLEDIKYSIFKKTNFNNFEMDKPPFDGLEPTELTSRLNYIYYATANPYKPISYIEFKTHADNYLDNDGTKLSTNDPKLLTKSAGFYPQLTADQINTRDCLNYGSGPKSCFQSPQLFFNINNDFNILTKGVNIDNSNLVIREDFTNPMILDPNNRYMKPLFANAPQSDLDRPLDQESNETIQLNEGKGTSLCRNCKLAVCKDDYCSLQNNLFM
jgi:hypothetical protein